MAHSRVPVVLSVPKVLRRSTIEHPCQTSAAGNNHRGGNAAGSGGMLPNGTFDTPL
jgi:hypothetical protein